ncbi:hypothetical protein AK812_SmicGene42728 [Symbiodinium microadriaticum]|uniref:Uncharacterized protein n=1 Tax=Symbiodinium microadriaticum TaxID=2951 RepID=A0A1Q9C2U2_SYMMI|nr:hypothetical protein AK812_SmicGene42728 [Symbiodinium microadriaticum]
MGKVAGAAFLDVAGVRNHEAPRDPIKGYSHAFFDVVGSHVNTRYIVSLTLAHANSPRSPSEINAAVQDMCVTGSRRVLKPRRLKPPSLVKTLQMSSKIVRLPMHGMFPFRHAPAVVEEDEEEEPEMQNENARPRQVLRRPDRKRDSQKIAARIKWKEAKVLLTTPPPKEVGRITRASAAMSQPPSGSMVFDHNAPATKQFMEQRATYQTAEYRAVQSAFFGPPRVKRSAPTPVHSGLTTPQEGTLDDEIMQEARVTLGSLGVNINDQNSIQQWAHSAPKTNGDIFNMVRAYHEKVIHHNAAELERHMNVFSQATTSHFSSQIAVVQSLQSTLFDTYDQPNPPATRHGTGKASALATFEQLIPREAARLTCQEAPQDAQRRERRGPDEPSLDEVFAAGGSQEKRPSENAAAALEATGRDRALDGAAAPHRARALAAALKASFKRLL